MTQNTNVTSHTSGTDPVRSEALLLIDDPQPGVVNTSNGYSYYGQVLGTPYVPAGSPGSGNVYQAQQYSPTSVTWVGVPFVEPGPSGTRSLRLIHRRGCPLAGVIRDSAGNLERLLRAADQRRSTDAGALPNTWKNGASDVGTDQDRERYRVKVAL